MGYKLKCRQLMQNRLHRGNLFMYQRTEALFYSCFLYTCKIPSDTAFLKGIDTDSSDRVTLSFGHRKSLTRDTQNSHLTTEKGHVTYTQRKKKPKLSRHKAALITAWPGQAACQHNALPCVLQKTHIQLDKNISAG